MPTGCAKRGAGGQPGTGRPGEQPAEAVRWLMAHPLRGRIQMDRNSADQASRHTCSCYNPAARKRQYRACSGIVCGRCPAAVSGDHPDPGAAAAGWRALLARTGQSRVQVIARLQDVNARDDRPVAMAGSPLLCRRAYSTTTRLPGTPRPGLACTPCQRGTFHGTPRPTAHGSVGPAPCGTVPAQESVSRPLESGIADQCRGGRGDQGDRGDRGDKGEVRGAGPDAVRQPEQYCQTDGP